MSIFRIFHLFLFLFFGFPCLLAQPQQQFQFQDLSMEMGLSNVAINCAFKDNRGFIWFGTSYGLNRYDGYQFDVFTSEKHGLASNRIEQIAEDQQGMLWLAHPSGYWGSGGLVQIDILDPITYHIQPVHKYLPNDLWRDYGQIHQVLNDQQKRIWIILKNGSVYRQDQNQFKLIYKHHTFVNMCKAKLTPDGLWIWNQLADGKSCDAAFVTPDGAVLYSKKNIPYLFWDAQSLDDVLFYTRASMVSAFDIYKRKGDTIVALFPNKDIQKDMVYVYSPFNPDQFWAWETPTLYPSEIYFFDKQGQFIKTLPYNTENERKHAAPMSSIGLISTQAILHWKSLPAVNQAFGINLQTVLFQTMLTGGNSLWGANRLYECRSIVPTSDGQLYLLGSGKYLYNPKTKTFKSQDHWATWANFAVYEDQEKRFWRSQQQVQQNNYPPLVIEDGKGKVIHELRSVRPISAIWNFYELPNETMLLAHSKGISYVPPTMDTILSWKDDGRFPCLSQGNNYFLLPRPEGVWLASETGLYLLDIQKQQVLEHYHTKGDATHYLPHDHIAHIHADSDGIFWLASKGGGLIRFNPQTKEYQQFTIDDGLSHNVVYAVYGDQHQSLWLSSNYGIMQFDKKTHLVYEYHKRDGLSHEEFNTTSHYQAPDGTIYFGSLSGFTYFQPEDFYKKSTDPNIPFQISKFTRRNRDTGQSQDETADLLKTHRIVQYHEQEEFILRFSLLNFIHTENNRYAYKMEGLDKDWTYTKEPQLYFSNLPYGDYTLKLKAQGKNGFWQEYAMPIQVQVPRPFYLTTSFRVLMLLLFLVAVYLGVRWRVQRLETKKLELEKEIEHRTQQIVQDKVFIEQQATILKQQAEELKGLDKAKNIFFANISHELRTPLTLILSPTESLLYQRKGQLDERVQSVLQSVLSNSKHLLRLVEEILDLAKLDANKLELHPEPTVLETFILSIADFFRVQANEKGIHFHVIQQQVDENLVVELDVNKMEKIIFNLLSNAFKFTPSGGTIELGVSIVEDKTIQFKVRDTGRGIEADDLPKIFERFFQSQHAEQRTSKGTGIGLAFCKGLVELMQGTIQVQSAVGIGSLFIVSIPIITSSTTLSDTLEEPKTIEDVMDDIPLLGYYRIAIAEDHQDLRKFLVDLLSPQFEVVAFENGKLLHDYLLQEATPKVDLVISDLMMPEMDGFELLQQLKQHPHWQYIPSIILTARVGERDKLQALTMGVDDYLTKPFSATELIVRVRNLLRNYQQRLYFAQAPILVDEEEEIVTEESPDSPQHTLRDQQWIKEIEQTILANIKNADFSLDALAQEHFISKRQLQRRIQKITGLNYSDYIKELRLQKARQLLEDGSVQDMKDLMHQIGLKTSTYFAKSYKERFGKTPF